MRLKDSLLIIIFMIAGCTTGFEAEKPVVYDNNPQPVSTLDPVILSNFTETPSETTTEKTYQFHFETHAYYAPIQSVQCSINDSAWMDCSSPVTGTNPSSGRYTFQLRVTDQKGYISLNSYSWDVLDSTAGLSQ